MPTHILGDNPNLSLNVTRQSGTAPLAMLHEACHPALSLGAKGAGTPITEKPRTRWHSRPAEGGSLSWIQLLLFCLAPGSRDRPTANNDGDSMLWPCTLKQPQKGGENMQPSKTGYLTLLPTPNITDKVIKLDTTKKYMLIGFH